MSAAEVSERMTLVYPWLLSLGYYMETHMMRSRMEGGKRRLTSRQHVILFWFWVALLVYCAVNLTVWGLS